MRLKKGDKVQVVAGNDKGKQGKILQVLTKKNRVIVEGVRIVKKHQKPNQVNQQGGIIEKEASIDASNVMIVCDTCKKPVRIGKVRNEDGSVERICKACKKPI